MTNADAEESPESRSWRYPYGRTQRYHLQHVHLFASDVEATIAFYRTWFDAEVIPWPQDRWIAQFAAAWPHIVVEDA